MAVQLSPLPIQRFCDNNGNPLANGQLFTYAAGTSTPQATYTDSTGATSNPNPVILDARGEAPVWLTGGQGYKFVLQDYAGNTIRTVDQIFAPLTPTEYSSGSLARVVTSIANLKALSKTAFTEAIVTGYYAQGDGGGGIYYYDSSDTTSADNGGTIIVATDGGRWKLDRQEIISVKQFGAKGDGSTDDTSAINSAFSALSTLGKPLYFPAGTYMVRESSSGSGYAILNPGVSFYGDGMTLSTIKPLTSMPNTANFMKIQPTGGAYLDFMFVRDMFFQPTNGSTKYGASCMYWNFPAASNASAVEITGVYCAPGNDYSMVWNTNISGGINVQGIPAELVVTRCAFWEGTNFIGAGDSNRFRDCLFRSTSTSTRVGVQFNSVGTTGNAPSALSIEDCNFDCAGGAVWIHGSYQTSIRHNNIEMSAGAGSGSGACIDIDGDNIANSFASIRDNLISLFGTTTATSGVRINKCEGGIVDCNRFLTGITPNQAILITTNAVDTYIGLNEIASGWTVPINDLGATGTKGTRNALTLLNSFTNTGTGFATASVIKDKDGRVTLEGLLSHAGAASGTIVCTLPTGFRPVSAHRIIVEGTISGAISPMYLEITTDGNVKMVSSGTVTSLSISGVSFNTNSYISSSN
jgi:hypothetical protein